MAQAMRADLFDIACDFYLAGPEPFVQTLYDELRDRSDHPRVREFFNRLPASS